MNLVTGHVVVVVTVAVCATVLGMAHVILGSDSITVYVGCLASFGAHGAVATVKNGRGG
jgi:hypothetical protein